MPFIGSTAAARWLKNLKANLDKKQDALTTAQLNAVNSGVTSAKVTKWDNTASAGGEANVIETVKVNGTALTPDSSKAVNVTVPSYSDFTGATSTAAGSHGLVPAPSSGATGYYLKSDGNWEQVPIGSVTVPSGFLSSTSDAPLTQLLQSFNTRISSNETKLSATGTSKLATTGDVNTAIASAQVGAAMFQGTLTSQSGISNGYKKGYYWVVSTAGTYVGQTCEAGDMIFAIKDATSSTALTNADFSIVQNNLVEMTTAEVDSAFTAAGLSVASS